MATAISEAMTPEKGPFQTAMDYGNEAKKYYTTFTDLLNNNQQYDPNTDPAFASYQQQYRDSAQQASNRTMAEMNRRGILDSDMTSNGVARIQQDAEGKANSLIPQLAANFQNQRQNQINTAAGMFSTLLGAGQNEQAREDNQAQRAIQNAQVDKSYALQEAATTGRYMPKEAQGYIDTILQAKRSYGAGGTDEQLAGYRKAADDARGQLAALGIDANALFGSEVDLGDAEKNVSKAYAPTANSQQGLLSTLLGLGQAYGSLPQGTAGALGGNGIFSSLAPILGGLEGKQTLGAQNQTFNQDMAKQQLDFTKEKFDFDVKQAGFENQLKSASQALQEAKNQQDIDYKDYLKGKDLTEAQAKTATNGYLSQVLAKSSRSDAIKYIVDHANDVVNDGADIDSILRSIDAKWPKPSNDSSGNASAPPSIAGSLN